MYYREYFSQILFTNGTFHGYFEMKHPTEYFHATS